MTLNCVRNHTFIAAVVLRDFKGQVQGGWSKKKKKVLQFDWR